MLRIIPKLFCRSVSVPVCHVVQFSKSFLSWSQGSNLLPSMSSEYLENLYHIWKEDPTKVDQSWDPFFHQYEIDHNSLNLSSSTNNVYNSSKSLSLYQYIQAFEKYSHLIATVSPLQALIRNDNKYNDNNIPYYLKPEYYGLNSEDQNTIIPINQPNLSGIYNKSSSLTLQQIQSLLYKEYCGTINIEYMHLNDPKEINWFREEIESNYQHTFNTKEQIKLFEDLSRTTLFERYIRSHYSSMNHYNIEGIESFIPGVRYLLSYLGSQGIKNVVTAMTTRGRLSFLSHIMNISYPEIFYELNTRFNYQHSLSTNPTTTNSDINKNVPYSEWNNITKSLYYEGKTFNYICNNNNISISLLPFSSSYNEIVTSIVMGKTKARQTLHSEYNLQNCVPIIFHGDSSFSSDGTVFEVHFINNYNKNSEYNVGGMINIIINNQTFDSIATSVTHSADIVKSLCIPIIHINSENPESVALGLVMAAKYRQKFNKSIVVDIVGINRYDGDTIYGYINKQNEIGKEILNHPTCLDLYMNKLITKNTITLEKAESIQATIMNELNTAYNQITHHSKESIESSNSLSSLPNCDLSVSSSSSTLNSSETSHFVDSHNDWDLIKSPLQLSPIQFTGLDDQTFSSLGNQLYSLPTAFSTSSLTEQIFNNNLNIINNHEEVTWEIAEELALSSLLQEGYYVLYNTQNIDTLSTKSMILYDSITNKPYIPLSHIYSHKADKNQKSQNHFHLAASSLSISSYLGYSLGYSYESPLILSICEPQVYDFNYNIQNIIDTFIAPGEIKYNRQSALILLLSHGYSYDDSKRQFCKLERFLSLCNDDPDYIPSLEMNTTRQVQLSNLQVCNVTTPSNYFHVLRRQLHRQFRKPLILLLPTNIFKEQYSKSKYNEFIGNTRFQRLIPDYSIQNQENINSKIRKLIFCTGKIYYELNKTRNLLNIDDVAIIRIEQISPFPFDLVAEQLQQYPNAKCIWCQEEPKNMGAYQYVKPRFHTTTIQLCNKEIPLYYVGRPTASSSDSVYGHIYKQEQDSFIKQALE